MPFSRHFRDGASTFSVFAILAALGCASERPCSEEECPGSIADEHPSPPSPSPSSSPTASSEPLPSTPLQPSTISPQPSSTTLQGCVSDADCIEGSPTCSPAGICVPCLEDTDCPGGTTCLQASRDEENRCVECTASEVACPDGLLCVQERCVECDPDSNQGCEEGHCAVQPFTTGGDTEPSCVECLTDDDCETGACLLQRCVTCDPSSNAGCPLEAPFCMGTTEADAGLGAGLSCVECLQHEDCATGVCENNTCVACSLQNHLGCSAPVAWCTQLDSEAPGVELTGDGGMFTDASAPDAGSLTNSPGTVARRLCVECLADDDCRAEGLGYCVNHTCQPCDPVEQAGCPDALPACVVSESDGENHLCVQCSQDAHCDVGRCHEHACVECAASTDCTDRRSPRCTAEAKCGACESDDDCSHIPGLAACESTAGACVECTDNSHCTTPDKEICDRTRNICVECTETEFDHCENGCSIVPGAGFYECVDVQREASSRCHDCGGAGN